MNQTQDCDLIITTCRHLGRQCPAALGLAQRLWNADRAARIATPDLEITGSTRLDGCTQTCPALFEMSRRGVALYCGVGAETDLDDLHEFAETFVDAEVQSGLAGLDAPPLAFVLGRSGMATPQVPRGYAVS